MATLSSSKVLAVIVISQVFCTSLWFAGNAVMNEISMQLQLDAQWLAHLTSAVQFGFIAGTFLFALFGVADRISPSLVFFFSAVLAAASNLLMSMESISSTGLFMARFATGFFLAGIYPVGMKIAADYFEKGLGKSLGFLLGALVLGTAFPHLLKSSSMQWPWKYIVYTTSGLALLGGITLLLFVPDGPFRKAGQKPRWSAFLQGFRNKSFRAAAFGYFGHMWELYAVWAFIPVILSYYQSIHLSVSFNISLWSFFIISAGSLACILAGMLSQKWGERKIAFLALCISCSCCFLSPFFITQSSAELFFVFLLVWGFSIIADSPMFSTLVAKSAPAEAKAASLTIVNSIGFGITILSIQIINALINPHNTAVIFMILGAGPLFGLIALYKAHR